MEDVQAEDDALRLPLVQRERDGGGEGGGGDRGGHSCAAVPQLAGATVRQTCFNLVNIYVGIGLLSMPYAIMKGGYLSLVALVALVLLLALSGQLICKAFDLMPAGRPKNYPELGRAAGGSAGMRIVMVFSFLELFGGSVAILLVIWQMLELLLPSEGWGPLHPMQLSACISTACLLPLLFFDLRRISRLSMLGSVATAMVVCMVLALVPLDPHRTIMPQQPPATHHLVSSGIMQACGIFALSASAHSTLPALRSAMHKPSKFPAALTVSFGVMLATYLAVAAAGYWYWGDNASPLVTADLAMNSFYSQRLPIIDRVLALFILINGFTKYPGLNLILQDLILSVVPLARDAQGSFHPPLHWVAAALRLTIFAVGILLALTAYSVLGSMLSLLGGLCSLTCSLLLPTAFYSLLAWRQLRLPARCGLAAMLALGVVMVCSITAINLCQMVDSCGPKPQPLPVPDAGAASGWDALQGLLLPGFAH